MVCILKGDIVVSRSKNLRGVLRYASRHGVEECAVMRCEDGEGTLYVYYRDGAKVRTQFADYKLLVDWANARRFWPAPIVRTE